MMLTTILLSCAFIAPDPAATQPATRPVSTVDRLADARDRLRAAGLPPTLEEFGDAIERVPEDQDAAVELLRAAKVMDGIDSAAWEQLEEIGGFPLPPMNFEAPEDPDTPDWNTILTAAEDLEPVFRELDGIDAKLRPNVDRVKADFKTNWRAPEDGLAINVLLPHLSPMRQLAKRSIVHAFAQVFRGDHAEALVTLRRTNGIADAIDAPPSTLVDHLVAIAVDALTAGTIGEIAPHLEVDDDVERQARLTIDLLLDASPRREGWRHAMGGEVIFQQNAIDHLLTGQDALTGDSGHILSKVMTSMFTRPFLRGDAVELADLMLTQVDAADGETYADSEPAREANLAFEERVTEGFAFDDMAAGILYPSTDRALLAHYNVLADRNRAAVALAIALYRHDHDDALPPTLDALVPDYLPRVPVDTLSPDASPVRYDGERGILWTVGRDLTDHGGRPMDDVINEDPTRSSREVEAIGYDNVTQLLP